MPLNKSVRTNAARLIEAALKAFDEDELRKFEFDDLQVGLVGPAELELLVYGIDNPVPARINIKLSGASRRGDE